MPTRLLLTLILAPLLLRAPYALAQDGLIAHWDFEQIQETTTPDVSGNGNDAQVNVATVTKGVDGRALDFDGEASTVVCLGAAPGGESPALTLEAWVRPAVSQFTGFPAVLRLDGAYALRYTDRSLGFLLWFAGNPVALQSAKTDWVPGTWYHIVGTYDGNAMRLYIDGQLDPASPVLRPGMVHAGVAGAYIGSNRGQYAFKGAIDEVRVYDRALSAEEVAQHHAAGREALTAQADVTVEPVLIGKPKPPFRKPARQITMVQDGFLWIDAEDFTDYGGWSLDTQFVHLMGSAYLIAAGVGKPVADATVQVDIPRAGSWKLWVRSRNWLKDHSPGQFRVRVGDKSTETVFGAAPSDEWQWEDGGDFDLPAGRATLALQDLTGYYGRCDALILTTDKTYTPPDDLASVRQERSRLTGISLEPVVAGDFDVIIVGAGSAGSPAALAAARLGAKTALIQNRPILGGNSSDEMGVPINGAASAHPNAREAGIIEEAGRIKARFGYPKMSEPFRVLAENEPNLSVFVNQHVFAVEMTDAQHIGAVLAVDTLKNTVSRYTGRMFVDCTGDGWVGFYAGAEFRRGRESRDEFGESLAPEKPDEITMSGCLMDGRSLAFRSVDTGKPSEFVPPAWVPKLPPDDQFGRNIRGITSGEWWLEHPGEIDDTWNAEQARDALILVSFAYWNHIKNHWAEKDRARNFEIASIPILDAKRESRRIVGDYMLNQNDCQSARQFEDAISYGGWPLDVHHPEGIYSGPEGPFHTNAHVPIYTIPYRSLYSRNIENLLMAGRCMSVTHIALGSVRVQGTLATTGQAAGTAAAYAVKHGITPRDIYTDHMADFQQLLLKNDQYIPNVRNQDPADLARFAAVTASSTAEFEYFDKRDVSKDVQHPLETSRAMLFPVGPEKRLNAVYVLLRNATGQPVNVIMHLRESATAGQFDSKDDLAVARAELKPGENWVEFRFERDLEQPFAWVWLEVVPGVHWYLMDSAPPGCCRAYGGGQSGDWTVVKGQYYALYTDPSIAVRTAFRPENVINGIARIVDTEANMWASAAEEPLPQWVQLNWDQPVTVNTVHLTFDTDMNMAYHTAPLPPQCVRDYELACEVDGDWRTVAREKGNFQRKRVHRFTPVTTSRIRLTVTATNGSESARVFEIRAYNE